MPWKECRKVEEKLRFVARHLEGESISSLCREFGISRVTGHKLVERYRQSGMEALSDRSKRPYRMANQLPFQIESLIVDIKKEFPTWGAPKIRERMLTRYPDIKTPAKSTVHAVLERHGLVKHKRAGARPKSQGTVLLGASTPNELWCTDFKGEFMLADRRYCYPLTVTDFHSRFLLCCEGLESTREAMAMTVFERLFREYGLPQRIRSDNGVPFASAHALHGLSRLAVWWLRLGIEIERIKPGNPQQNGRHERMHRTLKQATTRPPAINMLQQQDKFEDFIREYNYDRPHEALEMKTPSALYEPSKRLYEGLPPVEYPFHDRVITVTECGRLCLERKKINLSTVLAGQNVGVKQVDDQIWQVSFMDYDLGFFDMDSCRVEPGPNPFGPRVLTM
jgi:transposase InsO family protein